MAEPKPPQIADPEEVAEWAQGLTPTFQHCRDRGHDYEETGNIQWSKEERAYEIEERCHRCEREQLRLIDSHGYIVDTIPISYPEGYLRDKGQGRLGADSRAAIRLVRIEQRKKAAKKKAQAKVRTKNGQKKT